MKKFLFFLILNLVVHLPFLNLPPCGTHVWRQCNTLAMARNFAEEDMDILSPRIDRRNATNGITGSNFPLYEWCLAALSKVFGFSDLLSRLFSMLLFSIGMWAFYCLLKQFGMSEQVALIGACMLLSIPELYYHSINALPDVMALSLSLWALVSWIQWQKEKKILILISALVLSIIAGLIKFQFLMLPISALVFMKWRWKSILLYSALWVLILAPVFVWYGYALELTRLNNLKEFGLWVLPISFQQKCNTLIGNLIMDLPEVLLGWPLLITSLILLLKGLRKIKFNRQFYFCMFWLIQFLCFYIVAIERMKNHTYYFIPLLPLFILVILILAKQLEKRSRLLIAVLVLNFAWAMVRIIPSRWVENKLQIPVEFSNVQLRNEFNKALPVNSKCVVGPDISGCIFFYFTHTKGYSFEFTEELVKVKQEQLDIDNMRAAGIKYLIIKDGALLEPFMNQINLKRKIKSIGSFEIWEL